VRASDDITQLEVAVDGSVIAPGDREYDRARRVWNAMIDKRPALVVLCERTADVVAALAFARECGLVVAVRGGGHSVAGNSTCDDGLVIDLSRMNQVVVDPERALVRAGGGSLLGELDRACQRHNLATPSGLVSHTGIGGLALGGGVGWLTRKYGLTCDSLVSAEVVLADGRVVRASESELPDLYWALRGGGGNFGIVTEFEFRCHPVPVRVPVGFAAWPLANAGEFLRVYRDLMPEQSNEMKATAVICLAPDADWVPIEIVGEPVCMLCQVWAGDDIEAAERAFKPFASAGSPAFSGLDWMYYLDLQTIEDASSGPGQCNYTKGGYLDTITDGTIEALLEAGGRLSAQSLVEVIPHGGAQLRMGDDDTAFSHREAMYSFNVFSRWAPEDAPWERYIEWARATYGALEPYATGGVYTNFFSEDDRRERVVAAYGPQKYRRLAELKARYDPGNVFSLNGNIEPAISPAGAR
jgi:FAD/FMN-containing dehydrogenase